MATKSWMDLLGSLIVLLISYVLQAGFVIGQTKDYQSLHPVQPSYPPRRQLAQPTPALNIYLHYAEANYEEASHYAATIAWKMRYPTIVASDNGDIRSLSCDVEGIHLDFASPNSMVQAQKWQFPLVIVLDGNVGGCAPEEPSQERYHPFYVEFELKQIDRQPSTLSFSGFRSRWDIVAYDHEVEVFQVATESSKTLQNSVDRRRQIQTPSKWQISPSLNFDRQKNTCSKSEIPINLAAIEHGSVSVICRNCFIDTTFQLSIYSASRIIDAGIKSISDVMRKLYRAEQTLMRLSQSTKKIEVSQFSTLSDQLTDAISTFYNLLNDLALSADSTQKNKIKQDLNQVASLAGKTSLQLLANVKGQLGIGFTFSRNSLRDQFLLVQEIKEIISSTSSELERVIVSGEELVMNELSLPVCSATQEDHKFPLGGACRHPRKEASTRLTGRFRANADLEITLTGAGTVTTGAIDVLSVNLAGIQIPGIISIGPQVRLISQTDLVFTSSGTLTIGGDAEWHQIDALIYENNQYHHQLNHTNLIFHRHPPRFEINPQQLSLVQHFKPQVTFGIELLLGAQQLIVGIGGDIGLVNTFQLPSMLPRSKCSCFDGIKYDFNVTAQLESLMSVPASAVFLLSKLFPILSSAANLVSYPLVVAPNLNLIDHCFKLPTSFWSHYNRTLSRVLPSNYARKLLSSELGRIL